MKFSVFFVLLLSFFFLSQCQTKVPFQEYSSAFSTDSIASWIQTLSSVSFAGRKAGTASEQLASAWLVKKMEAAGLQAPYKKDGFLQHFRFIRVTPKQIELVSQYDTFRLNQDFYFTPLLRNKQTIRLVYGGTGSEADLQNLNVKGKVVAVYNKPSDSNSDGLEAIITRVEQKGADGILFTYPDELFSYIPSLDMYEDDLKHTFLLPEANPAQVDSFFYILTRESRLFPMLGMQPNQLGPMRKKSTISPGSLSSTLKMNAVVNADTIWSDNVIGLIEGTSLKEEVIVISAHYDHLGSRRKEYFPGADDNATGISALLSVAQAFQLAVMQGHRPLRTVVFAAFTAEELGEIGSAWFARHSPGKTILNLNMDMIGRTDQIHRDKPSYVYYLTSQKEREVLSSKLRDLAVLYTPGLALDDSLNRNDFLDYYHRSDQLSFAVDEIPFVVFTTGEHPDYHKPTDTPEKVQLQKVKQVALLIGAMAWEYAYSDFSPGIQPTRSGTNFP